MRKVILPFIYIFFLTNFCFSYWDCEWDLQNKASYGDVTLNEMLSDETSVVKIHFLSLIRIYHLLFSGKHTTECNFYPSCSRFTFYAIKKFGSIKGVLMGLDRINRCNQFSFTDYYDIDIEKSLLYDPIENESLFDNFFNLLNF
jgi:putative component of membrane protein insertase Oxa1/YidC/SpoIIIJ protein YidD